MSPLRQTETKAGGRARAVLLALLLAAAGFLAVRALVEALRDRVALDALWGGFGWLEAALVVSVALVVLALLTLLRGAPAPGPWTARAALYLAVLGAAVSVTWLQPYRRLVVELLAGALGGLFAALVLASGPLSRLPRRLRSSVDLALLNACVLALAGELGLRVWAAHSSSPMFAPDDAGAVAMIERWRLRPGSTTLGFPVNSHRFMDEEFATGAPGKPVVATIGDSFSASIVPHWFHFTTVAERDLPGVPFDNIGVAAIGPREYEHLLLTEGLPLKPSVVVVDIFIGNDLTAPLDEPAAVAADPLRDWFDRDRLLLLRVFRVLESGGGGGLPTDSRVIPAPAELERLYPWLADPMQEVPGMTEGQYARLEAHRAREACGQVPPPWPALFDTLRRMHHECEKIGASFAVMLIPDEFQVEDDTWARVLAELPGEHLDRDLPQRVLDGFCAEEHLPCLDLLPRLRAVPPLADGRHHLYSLRDTHWNRRGNEAAGHALAEFVKPLLPPEK